MQTCHKQHKFKDVTSDQPAEVHSLEINIPSLPAVQTCHKQYKTAAELETHLSSYDHHHKKVCPPYFAICGFPIVPAIVHLTIEGIHKCFSIALQRSCKWASMHHTSFCKV